MRTVPAFILVALAAVTTAAVPPDDAELTAASTRFALTATNDPAYHEVLAAYCRLIRAQIEGLANANPVERNSISRADLASGTSFVVVGRGRWRVQSHFDCHVLTDHPFWTIGSHMAPSFQCGQAIFIRLAYPSGEPEAAAFVGISREDLAAAAAGRPLPDHHPEQAEFPPLGSTLRKTELPVQYDTWIPGKVFRKGELIPVYSVLRNRLDSPQRIDWWRNVYYFVGEDCVKSDGGPDGNGFMNFALYAVRDGVYRRIESPNGGADFWTLPWITFPPRGSYVYTMLLNGAYDVSQPGEYEISSTYRSNLAEPDGAIPAFTGLAPAPPVRFRIVPWWHLTQGRSALMAAVMVALVLSFRFLLHVRGRSKRSPVPPESQSQPGSPP